MTGVGMANRRAADDVPDVCVILCCYYLTPAEMVTRCRSVLKLWPGARLTVYSTNPQHAPAAGEGVHCRQVPNDFNDFSAYIAACRDLVEQQEIRKRGTAYIFINDTLFARHPGRLLLRLLRRVVPTVSRSEAPLLCGKADSYRVLLQTSPFSPGLDRYVSTFLFGTNGPGIELLHGLFTSEETRDMMRGAAQFHSESIPPKFVALLRHNFLSGDPLLSWHGINGSNDIGRKAVCVLLEHLMSARFFEAGFIMPINYSPMRNALVLSAYQIRKLASRFKGMKSRNYVTQ